MSYIPISEIFAALRKTSAARSLQNMLRFNPYRDKTESAKHWKRILGPSSNSYSHMIYMCYFLENLTTLELQANSNFFSPIERETLLLAASCHDFGEAVVNGKGVGAVIVIWKKKEDEEKEHEIFTEVLDMIDLQEELKTKLLTAYNVVVREKTHKLSRYFKATEMVEYVDTILKVYKKIPNGYHIRNDKLLIGQVLTSHIPPSIVHAKQYISIKNYLDKNAHVITGGFKYSYEYYIKYNPLDKRKVGNIEDAWKQWVEFIDDELLK